METTGRQTRQVRGVQGARDYCRAASVSYARERDVTLALSLPFNGGNWETASDWLAARIRARLTGQDRTKALGARLAQARDR